MSTQTKLFEGLVRTLGIKTRLQKVADAMDDPTELSARVVRLRKFDSPSPPSKVTRGKTHGVADIGGFSLHIVSSPETTGRVLFHLHGGGYMFGPSSAEWKMVARIADGSGCDLAVLDYPKAPEHHMPETIDITQRAFEQLSDRYGVDNLALSGTSSGGGLAVAAMVERRDAGASLPRCALLLSPSVDASLADEDPELAHKDLLVPADFERASAALYAGEVGIDDPRVSPTNSDLARLPAMQILVGTSEILYPSVSAFAAKAAALGVEVDLIVGEDQQHSWPAAPTPEAKTAIRQMSEFLTTQLA